MDTRELYTHPCLKVAREVWARFVGIPVTEPYDDEFEWLLKRLLDLKDELGGNLPKRNLSEVCRELMGKPPHQGGL